MNTNFKTLIFAFVIVFLCLNLNLFAKVENNDFSIIANKTLSETWSKIIKYNFSEDKTSSKWEKIYEDSKKGILKSKNPQELVFLINDMIQKLGQSHIHLLPPMSKKAQKAIQLQEQSRQDLSNKDKNEHSENKGKAADIGLRLCVADGKLCVLDVEKNSSADQAGIKIGDVILAIQGLKIDVSQYSDFPWDLMAENLLLGNYNTKLSLSVLNSSGEEKNLSLKRDCVLGDWVQFGALPKIAGKVQYQILKGNIGYIYITPCFPKQIIEMKEIILNKLNKCKGLIVDVRNNPGGIMMMAAGMAGWLTHKKVKFGKMKSQSFTLNLESTPQENAFSGPLAVLIDDGVFSTAEVFAAGIQDNNCGKLFGNKTGGKCLPSTFLCLSTGYRLQTVFGDYTRINNQAIEKLGVVPDVLVEDSSDKLATGIDVVKESARKWLMKTHLSN